MDFLYTLLVMFATIWIYAYLIKPTNLKKKDLAPESEYPHVAIFKYYCVFAVSLATFLGFGFVMGVAYVTIVLMSWLIISQPTEVWQYACSVAQHKRLSLQHPAAVCWNHI